MNYDHAEHLQAVSVDGYNLAGGSDEDAMSYGMMIAMDDSTATISVFEP